MSLDFAALGIEGSAWGFVADLFAASSPTSEDTQATLTADAKFLANLKKQCVVTDKIKSMIKKMTFRLLVGQKDKYEHEL